MLLPHNLFCFVMHTIISIFEKIEKIKYAIYENVNETMFHFLWSLAERKTQLPAFFFTADTSQTNSASIIQTLKNIASPKLL